MIAIVWCSLAGLYVIFVFVGLRKYILKFHYINEPNVPFRFTLWSKQGATYP